MLVADYLILLKIQPDSKQKKNHFHIQLTSITIQEHNIFRVNSEKQI